MLRRIGSLLVVVLMVAGLGAEQPAQKSPKEALQAFSDLIGDWKCTGTPVGTREEIQKNFWTEKMAWEWQFKGKDVWLKIDFEKGKHFKGGELRYVPEKDQYHLTLTTIKNEKITYIGSLEHRDKTPIVTLERDVNKDVHRLVFTLLHDNVFNYSYLVKADDRPLFSKKWSVRAIKDGVSFAAGTGKPECIVSGGTGTSTVSYMGKTYYVCCSGCRDEFNSSPAKYVKEWEDKQKAKKK
jgi:YHS domain-containing protein